MTPCEIEVLIHYHVSPTPHPRINAPGILATTEAFFNQGLIEQYESSYDVYQTTKRGAAHIDQLCATALPVSAWVDQHGDVINHTL